VEFWENKNPEAKFTSLTSPVGLSSAAVVKTKLREEKTLAGFDLTGHSESHIQPELVNPIYAAENSTTLTNPKLTNWGASPPRCAKQNALY